MSDNYLLILPQGKDFRPLQGKFKELGGFYTGIGYAFPHQHESLLKGIVEHLPGAKVHKAPLGGQTFESFKLRYKASYFHEKIIEIEHELSSYADLIDIDNLSEDSIKLSENLLDAQKEAVAELFHSKEKLTESMEWAKGMEKALSTTSTINIQFLDAREVNFLTDDAPEMPRLVNFNDNGTIKPLIRKGIVAQVVGAGGVGKTHALAQLALAIATETNWFGIYPIERPGYVFMGLGENNDEDIHRLLRKVAKSQLSNLEPHHLQEAIKRLQEAIKRLAVQSFNGRDATFILNGKPTPFFNAFVQELINKEPEEGWSCIILDPISRFMGADAENDNAAATMFISLLEMLILELKGKPTVIFGHHMNKSGVSSTSTDQAAARGSSAITDGVRLQFNLERTKIEEGKIDEQKVTLRMVKSNFTAMTTPLELTKDKFGCLSAIKKEKAKDMFS